MNIDDLISQYLIEYLLLLASCPANVILVFDLFVLSYVWQHIEIGYVQGMCDLLAPLLVILDDGMIHYLSPLTAHFNCYCKIISVYNK